MNSYQKITDYLNRCVENNYLSHAYIFYGPDDSAKKAIVLKFANEILNTGHSAQAFNPDLILISADTDEERSINLIRQLKKFLVLSPYYGCYKIAVIDAAHKLNIYAQSALLKIFEEAPDHAIIILCAKTIDGVTKTIASRGVKLPFWRKDSAELPADKTIEGIFNEIIAGDLKDPYHIFEKFSDRTAIEIFELWLWHLRTRFLFSPTKKLNDLLKKSQDIYFKLNENNINPKFAYDELLLNLWKF